MNPNARVLGNDPRVQSYMTHREYSIARLEANGIEASTPVDALERMIAERHLAPAIAFDDAPIRQFVEAASQEARQRGHSAVFVEHAVAVLVAQEFDAFERGCSSDPDYAAYLIETRLDAGHGPTRLPDLPALVARSTELSNRARRFDLGLDFIVVDLLRWEPVKQVLRSVGVDAFRVLLAYVHGGRIEGVPRYDGAAELHLFHDDFTPPELTFEILVREFELSPESAHALLRESRGAKRAITSIPAAERAQDALHRVRARCVELEMPLRLEIWPLVSSRR